MVVVISQDPESRIFILSMYAVNARPLLCEVRMYNNCETKLIVHQRFD